MYFQPYLQPYKGKTTRHDCPSCKTKLSFTLYLNGNTHEPIHRTVGKCNRESKCGYHYTPKQYFMDNPELKSTQHSLNTTNADIRSTPSPLERAGVRSLSPSLRGGWVGSIPFSFVEKSASYKSNFVRFLCEFLTTEQITFIGDNYALGATKNKEVIFWQIDIAGKVRTGKIMQYNPATGKRLKHESGAIDWVHNKLKKIKTLPEDFNLQQCFFGEHLLTLYPDKSVAIVESEKSALIASALIPNMIWLAAGNINGLSIEKCKVLKHRNVILYPDLGAYEKWKEKAKILNSELPSLQGEGSGVRFKITVSTLLEDEATDTDRSNGLDIADYMIEEMKAPLSLRRGVGGEVITQIQSRFTQELEQMIGTNRALLILIDKLQLVQI
jgi:hypothetical protein